MKSFYSIIRYVNNSVTNENLAIGIVMLSGNNIFYNFSKEKLSLASKLNEKSAKLLSYVIDNIKTSLEADKRNSKSLFETEFNYNLEFLNKLSVYSNNFLQFDQPTAINMEFNEESFNDFFVKYIDVVSKVRKENKEDKSFTSKVSNCFINPLKDVIDTNYKIKKGSLPKLFFDYVLDGIGVNGVIYSVKSIDINSDKSIDSLKRDISELESLNLRLDKFAESKDIDPDKNQHYLIVDSYKGEKNTHQELYDVLMESKSSNFPYKILDTSELTSVVKKIEKAKAQKFSTFVE